LEEVLFRCWGRGVGDQEAIIIREEPTQEVTLGLKKDQGSLNDFVAGWFSPSTCQFWNLKVDDKVAVVAYPPKPELMLLQGCYLFYTS